MINFNTLFSISVWKKRSVQILILANLLPLMGVLFFDWSLFAVMYLYWFENVIIGLFNIMRMSRAEGKNIRLAIPVASRRGIKARGIRVFLLADETAPPFQFLCPFIPVASGRGLLDGLVNWTKLMRQN
jgi:hypothetical protein